MKITKEEFKRISQENPLDLFHQGIRSKKTREKYTRTLRYILCNTFEDIFEGDFENRVNQFVELGKKDPQWMRDLLLNLSKKLKERTQLPRDSQDYLNPNSVSNYFKPIKKLFDMNDVVISWKRIYSTFPEENNVADTRGWTRDEIQKMLKFAKGSIDRAIILVSASSGIRAGAFDLNWNDLIPIYQVDGILTFDTTEADEKPELVCAMLRIYHGTSESYPAFITPEAYESIIDYKSDWIRDVRREPHSNEPIFKKEGILPRRATVVSIKKRVERMITSAGFRNKICGKRYEVPIMNGFRRFWNKTCKESLSRDSPLGALIKKEYMMGHAGLIKLDRNYFKTHVLELAEEYISAVPNLTISDEKRLRLENKKKTEKIAKLESQQKEIEELKLEVKRIHMKNKASEAMKRKFIEWAEQNPNKVNPIHIAKTETDKIAKIDDMVDHWINEHNGDMNGLLKSISKSKISLEENQSSV